MAKSILKLICLFSLHLGLAACGGGGSASSSGNLSNPTPQSPYGVDKIFEPQPWRGSFNVGTSVYAWQDLNREETYTAANDDVREVHVRLFYPTDEAYTDNRLKVIPHEFWQRVGSEAAISGKRLRQSNYLNVNWYVEIDATISSKTASFPLIIFSNGYGLRPENHVNICAELASKGYIVASVYHPFGSGVTELTDGTHVYSQPLPSDNLGADLELWSDDQIFALEQLLSLSNAEGNALSGKFDDRIGVMGHSYGGAAAYYSAWKDIRIQAAVNIDGTIFNSEEKGIDQPFMYIQNNGGYGLDIFEQVNNEGYAVLFNEQIKHISFADHVLFWAWDFPDNKPFGPMDGKQALEFTVDVSFEFFNGVFSSSEMPTLTGILAPPTGIDIRQY